MQPQRQYRIRRRVFLGLGGIVILGVMTLATIAVIQTAQATGVADRTRSGYLLLDHVRELQVAQEASRAAVLAAMATPTASALSDIQAADDVAQAALRGLIPDVAADPVLNGDVERYLASLNAWHDQWAVPVAAILSAGPPASMGQSLAIAVGDQLFATARSELVALRTTAASRMASMVAAYQEQSRIAVTGYVIAGGLLCVGVLLVGLWIIRTVVGPLRLLNETAEAQLRGEAVEFRAERDDEIGALASVLERLRVALEGRYREARRESGRAATLNQLGDLISFSAEEFEVVDATVRTLLRLVPTRRGDIQLVNSSRNRLVYSGAWGPRPPGLETPVPVDRVDRCPAIRRSAPFVVPDLSDDLAVLCAAHPVESGSLACIPLIAMGQPIGVIHLESDTPIADEVVVDAGRIAEQVASAIANARLMKTMESLAMTDGLTGLRNARFFDTYLEQELLAGERDREPLAVLMIDIDHFKNFNDTYGHPAGDEALRVFGRVVKASIRASDLAARYGGEEFVVALRHTDLDGAALVAEKLRAAVETAIVELGAGRYGRITISIGVAAANLEQVDQKSLLAAADAALYRAKSTGRNQIVVSGVLDAASSPAARAALAAGMAGTPSTPGPAVAPDLETVPTRGGADQVVPIGRGRRAAPAAIASHSEASA